VCARVCVMGRALYNKYKWALLRFYFVFVESVCARVFSPWLKYWRRRGGGGRPRPARPAPRRRRGAGPHGPADTRAARVFESREFLPREERHGARTPTAHRPGAGHGQGCGVCVARHQTETRGETRVARAERLEVETARMGR
jgi:hypothetical protein